MTVKKMQGKREADPPEYVGGPWDGQPIEERAVTTKPARITHRDFKSTGWYVRTPGGDYRWEPTP